MDYYETIITFSKTGFTYSQGFYNNSNNWGLILTNKVNNDSNAVIIEKKITKEMALIYRLELKLDDKDIITKGNINHREFIQNMCYCLELIVDKCNANELIKDMEDKQHV